MTEVVLKHLEVGDAFMGEMLTHSIYVLGLIGLLVVVANVYNGSQQYQFLVFHSREAFAEMIRKGDAVYLKGGATWEPKDLEEIMKENPGGFLGDPEVKF